MFKIEGQKISFGLPYAIEEEKKQEQPPGIISPGVTDGIKYYDNANEYFSAIRPGVSKYKYISSYFLLNYGF
jgi:hypothetical protein